MKFLCLGLAVSVALAAPAVTLPDCGGKTVKASDFGFASGDSTDALKAALNSDAARVVIDRQAEDWVTGSVAITNGNKEIVIEDGVVIRAKPGAFVGARERLFAIVRATNVVLRGVGTCGIVMRKREYQDKTRYEPSEFRDCIQIWGSKNVAVSNLFCRSSGGDGVEVTLSDGVLLEDLVCEDNHRQGSSINCCENLTVRRCVFNTTEGTWPMCGVDLEPFRKTQKLENILYEDCVFDGNRASGIDLHLSALDGTSSPVSVTFRRCKARRNRFFGLQMYSSWSTSGVKGSVTFEDCEFSDNGYCPMRITNQFADGLRIVFRNCTFDNRGGQEPHAILLDNARVMKNVGGITFENCRLTTEGDKVPVAIRNMTGFGVDGLGGEIAVVRDGRRDPYRLAAFVAANPPHPEKVSEFRAMPVDYACLTGAGGKLSEPAVTPPLGGNIVFIQHVPEAGRYPIVFGCRRLKGTAPWPRVQVRDRAGTDLGGFDLRDGECEHVMTVSGDALHRFEIAAGEDFAVTVASPWIGQGVQCDDFVRVLPNNGKGAHRAYFTVLGKAQNVRVEIESRGNSPAAIRDGSGEVLDRFPERCAHQSFQFDRPTVTEADETWSVEFPAPRTPFGYRIGGGTVSVWTTDPAAALKRTRSGSSPDSPPDAHGVYDGSQSNNVVGVAHVGGAATATLSCRVQTRPDANRSWKVLAICGDPLKDGWVRLSYNVRREGRIWGTFGGVRICSAPHVLDDCKLHHVAFEVSPGRELRLFVDGRQAATARAPDGRIAGGPLAVGQRVVVGSADDGWYYETGCAQHFRGRIVDVAVRKGPFDPRAVAGGVESRERALTIPPNPLEKSAVWERPKTTRRYLQGPLSERLLVYFREGKILFGENEHKDDWSVAYKDLVSHAAWLVKGERAEPLDFREAELSLSDGGEPDCAQTWHQNGLEITLSACAPWGRRPSAHLQLSVRNLGTAARTEIFGFLLRTAPEKDLVFGAPDIYASYAPSIADWAKIGCSDWKRDGETMRSGDRFAAVREGDFAWEEGRGMLRFGFVLKPGETRTAELELGRGESDGMDFETARAAMRRDWTRELARIRLPKAVADDAAKSRLIRHLAVQMLQCFAHPVGEDAVLPRQGGLQRYVWPGDAISFLSAMDELGYGDHVARAVDFYFDRCIRPTGEAGPFRNRWACDTGCVLESFARHVLLARDEACWRRHRDAAFRAFDWIEAKRREGGGLFPSMKSTDHGAASRHWGMTDMYSLTGLTDFAEAAGRMKDPRARDVRRAVRDYRAAIDGVLDGWKERASGRDELMIPLTAEGAADDGLLEDYMFAAHYGRFADFGFLSESDMLRVRRWLLRRRYADENGLYSNQVSRNGQRKDEHVWYTTWQDQHWFNAWMRVGRLDLARKTLAATLKFALTDEYLVGERYHDADAWYYPWSPNASGSGRIVQMLLSDVERADRR